MHCLTTYLTICDRCTVQYVEEVVIALSESPLKPSDIPAALTLASMLHQK
jgi:hypothetical protein